MDIPDLPDTLRDEIDRAAQQHADARDAYADVLARGWTSQLLALLTDHPAAGDVVTFTVDADPMNWHAWVQLYPRTADGLIVAERLATRRAAELELFWRWVDLLVDADRRLDADVPVSG